MKLYYLHKNFNLSLPLSVLDSSVYILQEGRVVRLIRLHNTRRDSEDMFS